VVRGNKDRYEEHLLEPALDFIKRLCAAAGEDQPTLPRRRAGRPAGSLFRIYRDTRFSKDKSPYKTNLGIHFRHERAKDAHAPGYYLHIGPDEVFAGWRHLASGHGGSDRHSRGDSRGPPSAGGGPRARAHLPSASSSVAISSSECHHGPILSTGSLKT
jgi:hypothetical protein